MSKPVGTTKGDKAAKHKRADKHVTKSVSEACMNADHTTPGALSVYKEAFRSGTPFPHLFLKDVFPPDLLAAVRDEILAGEFFPKRNDLYHFEQSDDLRKAKGNAVAALRDFIYSETFRKWMFAVTGIETNSTIDISAAKYDQGSYLLCHDDDLASRRIAYIIYLVPEAWEAADGGSLDLFSVSPEADTVPDAVVRSMQPMWNAMAFFEVSAKSHHQVAEVLNTEKGPRLSISGWLHGPPVARPPPPPPPALTFVAPTPATAADAPLANAKLPCGADDELAAWISPTYLKNSIADQVRKQFASAGSIELPTFLREDRYAQLMKALGTQRWVGVGPANMQHFKVCHDTSEIPTSNTGHAAGYPTKMPDVAATNGILQDIVARFYQFVTGARFAALIGKLTGASIGTLAARCRCFTQGDYTMITDSEYSEDRKDAKLKRIEDTNGAAAVAGYSAGKKRPRTTAGEALDVVLSCVISEEWPEEHGGYVSYLTSDEELLTVCPKMNTLSLVARKPGVMSFVKFVNASAEENRYDFALQYSLDG